MRTLQLILLAVFSLILFVLSMFIAGYLFVKFFLLFFVIGLFITVSIILLYLYNLITNRINRDELDEIDKELRNVSKACYKKDK